MNFNDAMKYMDQVATLGSVLGLESTRELLQRLGNPQNQLNFVHIAGTNGKGSTAAYISNILADSGYLIGRYISPTITCYCERIQITSKDKTEYIKEESVAKHLTHIREIIAQMIADGKSHPTPFEIETAMAFLEFVERGCDLVVLEVGMGGRLDSTNVIQTTKVAVLTSISMDHMQFLGDTLEKIAYEKAGIIKENCEVVSYEQQAEAKGVICDVCKEKHVSLSVAEFKTLQNVTYTTLGTKFDYKNYKNLSIQLLGKIQVRNATVAIETALILSKLGYSITEENIRDGLARTEWRGRFEIIHTNPTVILDGAHNEDAAYALEETLSLYFDKQPCIFVMGVLADKEYDKVLKITTKHADKIYTLTPSNSRGLDSKKLAEHARKYCSDVIDAKTVSQAMGQAMEEAKISNKPVIVFGSLSFHNEVYQYMNDRNK